MNPTQIAAEAWAKIKLTYVVEQVAGNPTPDGTAIIKDAMEKATKGKDKQLQSVVAFLETCKGDDWDRRELLKVLRLTVPLAAQASGEPCPVCGSISNRTKEQLADEISKLIKIGAMVSRAAQGSDSL